MRMFSGSEDYDVSCSHCRTDRLLEVVIQTEDDADYTVVLKDKDGRKISIMIPKYESYSGECCWDQEWSFGLNLVVGGKHYE